jgi:hypothetical protein
VQNVYDGNVVCNMYITEHGTKVNDTWQTEHHLFFGKYIANIYFLKVYNKLQICLEWKNKFGNLMHFPYGLVKDKNI